MAIYHLSCGVVSRSTGRSAVQSAAYITRSKITEDRRGLVADYTKEEVVFHQETVAPQWASDDFRDVSCWNLFENFEDIYAEKKYKTIETQEHYKAHAQTAQTVVGALPKELSAEDHMDLAREFVLDRFVSRGLVVTFALHEDEGNPHVHYQISRRKINEDGSIAYAKDREIMSRSELKKTREMWADKVNAHLEKVGLDVRIDHRSFVDQGVDLVPTKHEGWYARSLNDRGIGSRVILDNQEIKDENLRILVENPSLLLAELTAKNATFSQKNLSDLVQKRCADTMIAQHIYEGALSASVEVGCDLREEKRYTSTEYLEKEARVLGALAAQSGKQSLLSVFQEDIHKKVESIRQGGGHLSEEQEAAIRQLSETSLFSVLVGRAGTGKTTGVLKPVVELHESAGFRVFGMALSASAAENLELETGCSSKTIASYIYRWREIPKLQELLQDESLLPRERGRLEKKLDGYLSSVPDEKTVIILDEAGMVGTRDWFDLVKMASQTNAKLIAVGDDHQYKAIEAGDLFRKAIDGAKEQGVGCELTTIFRQRSAWMQSASNQLARLETREALAAYERQGCCVHGLATQEDLVQEISAAYVDKRLGDLDQTGVVLTSTNEVREAINDQIRVLLKSQGQLGSDVFSVQNKGFAVGDEIVFLKNDGSQFAVQSDSGQTSVKNGTTGIIAGAEKIERDGAFTYEVRVQLPTSEHVTFALDEYNHLDHAYAMTGHKSQGRTLDWSMVALSKNKDAYGLYVLLTRHRDEVSLYYAKEDVGSFKDYINSVQVRHKDLAVDYSISSQNKEFWFNVVDYKALGHEIMEGIRQGENVQDLIQERRALSRQMVEDRKNHKLFVMQTGLTFEQLEISAGRRNRPLTYVEEKAKVTVEQYAEASLRTNQLWQDIRKTHPGALAKTHEDYQEFEELRYERDGLASLIGAAPALHRPFLSEVRQELGYGFMGIKKQAKAFHRAHLERSLKDRSTDPKTHEALKALKAYIDIRDGANQAWRALKPQLTQKDGMALKGPVAGSLKEVTGLYQTRDKMAFALTQEWENVSKVSDKIGLSLDAASVFQQSEKGEKLLLVDQYERNEMLCPFEAGKVTPFSPKLLAAVQLSEMMALDKESGKKETVAVLLSRGVNLKDLRKDAHDFEVKQVEARLVSKDHQDQFEGLKTYDQLSQTAHDLYVLCKQEVGSSKELKTSGYYTALQAAQEDRNKQAAHVLGKGFCEDMKSLASIMGLSVERLETHAADHTRIPQEKKSVYRPSLTVKEIEDHLKHRMPELTRQVLGDPQHKTSHQWRYGRKGSLAVFVSGPKQGLYSNFETGVSGGPLTLIKEHQALSTKDAIIWSKDWLGLSENAPLFKETVAPVKEPSQKSSPERSWTPVLPVPDQAPSPDIENNPYLSYMTKDRTVKGVYAYKNESGQFMGYVMRIEDKDGQKITPTLTYCESDTGQCHWKWVGFGNSRPLFGLDRLSQNPNQLVLVVEGEKTAEAAQKFLPDHVVMTWSGGTGSVAKTDWTPLLGRCVTVWPDNDEAGLGAAEKITTILTALNKEAGYDLKPMTVQLPHGLSDKWDLADALPKDMDIQTVRQMVYQDLTKAPLLKASPPQQLIDLGTVNTVLNKYDLSLPDGMDAARLLDLSQKSHEKSQEWQSILDIKTTDEDKIKFAERAILGEVLKPTVMNRFCIFNPLLEADHNGEKIALIAARFLQEKSYPKTDILEKANEVFKKYQTQGTELYTQAYPEASPKQVELLLHKHIECLTTTDNNLPKETQRNILSLQEAWNKNSTSEHIQTLKDMVDRSEEVYLYKADTKESARDHAHRLYLQEGLKAQKLLQQGLTCPIRQNQAALSIPALITEALARTLHHQEMTRQDVDNSLNHPAHEHTHARQREIER